MQSDIWSRLSATAKRCLGGTAAVSAGFVVISLTGLQYIIQTDRTCFALHRRLSTLEAALQFRADRKRLKNNKVAAQTVIPMGCPVVLTNDPAKMSDLSYQTAAINSTLEECQRQHSEMLLELGQQRSSSSSDNHNSSASGDAKTSRCAREGEEKQTCRAAVTVVSLKEFANQQQRATTMVATGHTGEELFQTPASLASMSERYYLVQIICRYPRGAELEEPIIVVCGVFGDLSQLKSHADTMYKRATRQIFAPEALTVEADTRKSPWWTRENVDVVCFPAPPEGQGPNLLQQIYDGQRQNQRELADRLAVLAAQQAQDEQQHEYAHRSTNVDPKQRLYSGLDLLQHTRCKTQSASG